MNNVAEKEYKIIDGFVMVPDMKDVQSTVNKVIGYKVVVVFHDGSSAIYPRNDRVFKNIDSVNRLRITVMEQDILNEIQYVGMHEVHQTLGKMIS